LFLTISGWRSSLCCRVSRPSRKAGRRERRTALPWPGSCPCCAPASSGTRFGPNSAAAARRAGAGWAAPASGSPSTSRCRTLCSRRLQCFRLSGTPVRNVPRVCSCPNLEDGDLSRLELAGADATMTMISYAQNGEDVMLMRALGEVAGGFYIDAGAADPTVHSVTRAFYDRNWHGVNRAWSISCSWRRSGPATSPCRSRSTTARASRSSTRSREPACPRSTGRWPGSTTRPAGRSAASS